MAKKLCPIIVILVLVFASCTRIAKCRWYYSEQLYFFSNQTDTLWKGPVNNDTIEFYTAQGYKYDSIRGARNGNGIFMPGHYDTICRWGVTRSNIKEYKTQGWECSEYQSDPFGGPDHSDCSYD